jgi:hypothetical protein
LKKAGVLSVEDFFNALSSENNYMDPKLAREFYMGFVRAVTKLIRKNGVAQLPHIGTFALVKQKDHMGWTGKVQQMIRGKHTLKFYPLQSWRTYFSKLGDELHAKGSSIDPRERVLRQKL